MENSRFEHTPVPPRNPHSEPDDLRRVGFTRYNPQDLGPTATLHDDLRQITDAFAQLPTDPYAPTTNRFRKYSHLVYLPWTGQLSWIPGAPDAVHGSVTEYYQDDHNPEYPRLARRFPDIPTELQHNSLLQRLIRSDIEQVLWLDELNRTPVWAGVHMIKLSIQNSKEIAVSSPNCLHQDGGATTTFTFAHLIACHNIVGGENVIASPESAGRQPDDLSPTAIYARFTLVDPLDTYAVHDHRVSHYVSPVRLANGSGHGQRCILIIGIAPFAPRL